MTRVSVSSSRLVLGEEFRSTGSETVPLPRCDLTHLQVTITNQNTTYETPIKQKSVPPNLIRHTQHS